MRPIRICDLTEIYDMIYDMTGFRHVALGLQTASKMCQGQRCKRSFDGIGRLSMGLSIDWEGGGRERESCGCLTYQIV